MCVHSIRDADQLSAHPNTIQLIIVDAEQAMHDLKAVKGVHHESPVFVVDRVGDVSRAVKWVKDGARDVFLLDSDISRLPGEISNLYELWLKHCSSEFLSGVDGNDLVGNSPYTQKLRELLGKISRLPQLSVLIQGETGTGKGLYARLIHKHSKTSGDLVEINCAAIPSELLESELFGYESGAFTGAQHRKQGLLELAENGTLLLDEIGCMPLSLQAKILKCIEEKRFRRIGGKKEMSFQSRIISCANEDLAELTDQGKFRRDLYYRLNVFPVRLLPLRDRIEDISLLAYHFLGHFRTQYQLTVTDIEPIALRLLEEERWPGNVRELKHVIERAVIIREHGIIQPGDIGLSDQWKPEMESSFRIILNNGGAQLKDVEKQLIRQVLELTDGNRSHAARILGIPRSRLLRKIYLYKIGNSLKYSEIEDDDSDFTIST